MKTFNFKSEKSNRIYQLGEPSATITDVWFVLHGYGQLGKFFIRHFRDFQAPHRLILAPEGSHHFYLNGTDGRVGASWMTKENRLTDIQDYCNYLNQLKKHMSDQLEHPVRVHVLGFSQGVATAFRWVDSYLFNDLYSLHGWAGTFPPDIDFKLNQQKFNSLKISASFGSDDEYISEEKANQLVDELANQDINLSRFNYKGGHSFKTEKLKELISWAEPL